VTALAIGLAVVEAIAGQVALGHGHGVELARDVINKGEAAA
jgi:hypothetical protein